MQAETVACQAKCHNVGGRCIPAPTCMRQADLLDVYMWEQAHTYEAYIASRRNNMTDIQTDGEKIFPSVPLTATFELSAEALTNAIKAVSGSALASNELDKVEVREIVIDNDYFRDEVNDIVNNNDKVYEIQERSESNDSRLDDLEWKFDDFDVDEFDSFVDLQRRVRELEEDNLNQRLGHIERMLLAWFDVMYEKMRTAEDSWFAVDRDNVTVKSILEKYGQTTTEDNE